jgi:WD40 repeat protein
MSLFVDGVEPSKIFSGDTAVASVFVGAEKVWPTAVENTFEKTDLGVTGLGAVAGVALENSSGSLRLWAADFATGELQVIDVATGAVVSSFACLTASAVTADAIVPNATSLHLHFDSATSTVYGCDYDGYKVHVIRASDLTYIEAIDLPTRPRSSVTSPNGSTLYVSLSRDEEDFADLSSVRVLRVGAGPAELVKDIDLSSRNTGGGYIALTGDGRAYVSDVNGICVDEVDLDAGVVLSSFGGTSSALSIARSGGVERLFVARGGMNQTGLATVEIYDTDDNSLIRNVDGFDGATTYLVTSPDHRRVYVGTYVGLKTFQLDAETGDILASAGRSQVRFQVAVSPDSRYIATGSVAGLGVGSAEVFETNYAGRGTPAP